MVSCQQVPWSSPGQRRPGRDLGRGRDRDHVAYATYTEDRLSMSKRHKQTSG